MSVRFVPLESITSIGFEREGLRGTIRCRSDVVEGLNFSPITIDFVRERPFKGPLFRDIPDPEHVSLLIADAQAALTKGDRP
jgi:hypothetical protein